MKRNAIVFFLFCSFIASGQRYYADDFMVLDSVIGGVYGTSIDYQSNTQNLLFDFYEPANDTLTARPLLIYAHGGGYTTGTRTYPTVQMICRSMANKGYAVANIDYRLDPNFDIYNSTSNRRAMTDAMHDAKQAIRYFKANASTYKIDTSLVFIGGESAGAATSMMASFVNKQAEMGSYPMAVPNNPTGSTANPSVSNSVKGTLCLCGLMLDTNAIELPSDPPILWTHGTDDNFVPISLAFNIVLRASNVGLPIQTKVYQGGVHCPWYFGNPNWAIYLDSTITDIRDFLFPLVTNVPADISEYNPDEEVLIYPNPFHSELHIGRSPSNFKSTVKLLSLSGRVLYEQSYFPEENGFDIDLNDLEPGVYFLVLSSGDLKTVKKVIKQAN